MEKGFEQVWTEKYRPQTLDDVIGQQHIVSRLKSFVENRTLQNLLFAGPAGTGKTTSAIAVAKGLFGEAWRSNILELNASDERGIDVVRNKVKDFARTKALGQVPYKIIYLDESDALTREAQQALRRTMEDYTGTCRFILSANYNSKIIEPIQSRCALFRFAPLTEEDILGRLKTVSKNESLKADAAGLAAIVDISKGDMRTAINILQATAATSKEITEDAVYSVSNKAKPKDIEECVKLALGGKFGDARSKMDSVIVNQGISGEDALRQIHKIVLDLDIPEDKLVVLLDKIGEYDFRIIEGSDSRLQLNALLAQIYLIGKN